jgi:hypothetical protein
MPVYRASVVSKCSQAPTDPELLQTFLSALFLMLIFLTFIPCTAHGEQCQDIQARDGSTWPVDIHIGLRGSLNWVTFHGADADSRFAESTFKLRHVPTGGVTAGILSARDFLAWRGGLEFDASYITKGSGLSLDGQELGSRDHRYYDLALLARLEREAIKNLRGYLLLGTGVSFLRDATYVYSTGQTDASEETTDRDWRIVAGVGTRWLFRRNHHFTFDVRTDIGTKTIDATINNSQLKNLAISLSLGYQWSYPPRRSAASCPDANQSRRAEP